LNDKIREDGSLGGGREIWDLTGLSEVQRLLERSRHRTGVKIQTDYTEVYWIKLPQNRGNLLDDLKSIMNSVVK
jgi:hypothetical protein